MSLEKFRTYVGISLDKSYSITQYGLCRAAAKDYNSQIKSLKDNALQFNEDVIVSLATCGYGDTERARIELTNASVTALAPIDHYTANGRGTPLYDSIGLLIEELEKNDQGGNTSFMILAITDGQENASRIWSASKLRNKIIQLQSTDKWTFVLRVPKGYKTRLVRDLGIYEGNVQEWETTEKGLDQGSSQTVVAMGDYFLAKSQGVTATRSFYANVASVKIEDVKANLVDISNQVKIWSVQTEAEGKGIRAFVENKLGKPMIKGGGFYKLVSGKKSADKVQPYKLILIRHKKDGHVYYGDAARDLIGLSRHSVEKVRPGDLGNYDIFIQSTSVNRVLPVGTELIYWENFQK